MSFRSLRPTFLPALMLATALQANNIQVSTGSLVNFDGPNSTVDVQFTVSWENSWRTSTQAPFNWDAAWVFVKYRDASTGLWQHCRLGTAHTAPAGTTITNGLLDPTSAYNATTNHGVGVFLHRSADGMGTFTATNVRLRWNYGTNGVAINNVAEVRVFALEMVLVTEGNFWVGDGGTGTGRFIAGGSTNSSFQITSEAALGIANTTGSLWGTFSSTYGSSGAGATIGATGTLPAAYPKGFGAFYCMKYEISQQGYVDFLNTLTYTQQGARTNAAANSIANTSAMNTNNNNRSSIDIQTPGVASTTPAVYACNLNGNTAYGEATDGLWIACSFLTVTNCLAYLDWSGLRPMTELEYEKACRGPATPVADEYAWGSTAITGATSITNGGANNERSGTAGSNAVFNDGTTGPLRVGVFAAGTTRAQSGAGYYGAMELSGNLFESFVTVADGGRVYTGLHGDGTLATDGSANAANWSGVHWRGGSWGNGYFTTSANARTSDRSFAAGSILYLGNEGMFMGGRGGRRAP